MVIVRLLNRGLEAPSSINCGQPIPSVSSIQEIGTYDANNGNANNDWIEFTYINTTGLLFTQLWIYPESNGGGQYNLNILSVEVCPTCESSITFNNGVVPTGTTTRGYIYAGSSAGSGGSGTVTVDATATTEFIVSNEVNLLTEFEAAVSTGTFSVDLYTCYAIGTRKITGTKSANLPVTPPSNDMEVMMKAAAVAGNGKLSIYPTVGTGQINITGDLSSLENVELAVYDLTGRKIIQLPKKSYPLKATINLSNLNNGTYLLQIKQKDNSTTKKIIIQK